jgi:hypothetical protein
MRLITFGCSFTDYSWPTWADIIARDLGCEYENWAIGGGGNQQIARRILYRDQQFGWQPEDIVMVQWSSITREDRYYNTQWVSQGSVSMAPHYGPEWVDKYWSWNNDVINTAQARMSTEAILRHRLKYQMAMTWGDGDHLLADSSKITDFWRSRLTPCDELPSHARPFNGRIKDGHPDPRWWLNWVETKIYPQFGWQIKQSTRAQVQDMQRYLDQLVSKRTPQNELQHLATIYANEHGWPMSRKVKPGSDTLTPGQGSNILM